MNEGIVINVKKILLINIVAAIVVVISIGFLVIYFKKTKSVDGFMIINAAFYKHQEVSFAVPFSKDDLQKEILNREVEIISDVGDSSMNLKGIVKGNKVMRIGFIHGQEEVYRIYTVKSRANNIMSENITSVLFLKGVLKFKSKNLYYK